MHPFFAPTGATAIPLHFVTAATLNAVAGKAGASAFAKAADFTGKPGQSLLVPGKGGELAAVLFGIEAGAGHADPFLPGRLAGILPPGTYRFANAPHDARLAALAIALGSYTFTRYRKANGRTLKLVPPASVDAAELSAIIEGVTLTRDLVNTPSNDMGPAELEAAARKLAKAHRAKIGVIAGSTLARDFPLIQAVGQGSARAPRLIDMTWGNPKHPKITLVGKGVCFDTGGLDIKNDAGMLNMKKDMGGAATALGLAHMLMARKIPLRLRVLIPAVENSISGTSFRPRDIYRSRKGLTVEIGNTDAEGRLVLADALSLADDEKPELVVDFATLTGAARVALGPELPALFTDDDTLAGDLAGIGLAENDPVWRLPLWRPYEALLDSRIADTNNVGGGHGGAITAALFLRKFVGNAKAWAHFDIFAWTPSAKPGRPEGAECQAARALFALLKKQYC
ncbi:MAG: Peptidase B [Pseudolabrys sp.]|jgi:leucyl aminopeptidase|nr:Peptidase B [Pseudolabrys sp.]